MATTAEIYAQAKRDEAAKQLENLYADTDNAYNQQVEAAKANTQNILNQLTQSATDYQNQYEKDARSAYINRMQNERTVENNLARLGLGDSGYGVTQRLMPATDYGKNLTTLQDALSKNLLGIDQSKATANTELGNTLATLASNYAQNKQQTQMNVFDRLQDVYNNAYATKYQEEQDTMANQLAMAKAYSSSGGRSGGSSKPTFEWTPGTTFKYASNGNITYTNPNGASVTVAAGINPYTGTKNKDIANGTFSNGYQPNNVSGKPLSSVKGATVNIGGNQQNVWTTGSKNYVWNGASNSYVEVYNKNGEWIVK